MATPTIPPNPAGNLAPSGATASAAEVLTSPTEAITSPAAAPTSPTLAAPRALAAYKARWDAIMTATVYCTDTVRMLRPPVDPMEAPRDIVIEGKIDRLHQRSKVNIYLDFPSFRFGSQLKKSPETTTTLERSVLILNGQWIPFERKIPSQSAEDPEALLFDTMLLPEPDQGWKTMGEPAEHPITLNGQTLWMSFIPLYNQKETIEMQLSEDGQAIRTLRTFDSNGKLRSYGEVLSFASQGPFGLVPKEVAFRQYDPRGQPYRELKAELSIRFNNPDFTYIFE